VKACAIFGTLSGTTLGEQTASQDLKPRLSRNEHAGSSDG
jgi:hypothetical protein